MIFNCLDIDAWPCIEKVSYTITVQHRETERNNYTSLNEIETLGHENGHRECLIVHFFYCLQAM